VTVGEWVVSADRDPVRCAQTAHVYEYTTQRR
jgi:hypothetical protein